MSTETTTATTATSIAPTTTSPSGTTTVHKALKKQITYSYGMKLDNIINPLDNESDVNKLHRCKEVENLTEQQEQENEILNNDIESALHSRTHLKRTSEIENLNDE